MNKTKERIALEKQLINMLSVAQAHISFEDTVKGIRFEDCGKEVKNVPYTLWQLLYHLWFAQNDILEFSRNPKYHEPSWPDDYWPKEKAPKNQKDWDDCVKKIICDRQEFIELIKTSDDLYALFSPGSGQNLVREALLIADHNAYHIGQMLVLKRILGDY